ncbi:MAG: dephospho-CoA kinase [Bacteroidetes bacterium]|nr:dephospho-CoA kinase [Bacteroidota bacterium]MBS1540476.1 dephospho-CoA kinase [Bacteroidota bacterium]
MTKTPPLRVGITGGIGTGKSLVCKIFSVLGAPVYDADKRARQLMTEDEVLVRQIQEKFGKEAYTNGQLNRDYVSEVVFKDAARLSELNRLVHPRVAEDSRQWMAQQTHFPYAIKEAALLIESGAYKELDHLVVVTAPMALRTQRVLARDPFRTKEEIEKIISKQMPEEEKIKLADSLIYNNETSLVIPQVLKLHERFIHFVKE